MGDIVLTTPVIRCLRKNFPEAKIDFVIRREFSDLIGANPHLNRIITYDRATGLGGLSVIKKQIRDTGYDVIVDIHKNWRSFYLRYNTGAGKITIYHKRQVVRLLLILFKWNRYRKLKQIYLRYFEAVEPLGVHYDGEGTEVIVPDKEADHVNRMLESQGLNRSKPILVICPGASFTNKRWLPERFFEVAEHFMKNCAYSIVLLGGPDDRETCNNLQKRLGEDTVNLAGQLKLIQSAAMLRQASLVLTNDSGLLHLAQSQKAPVVAIFGPTTKELGYYPLPEKSRVVCVDSLNCRPCTPIGSNRCPKKHFNCMKMIDSGQVIAAMESLIP